jgi:hypothetical protein
MVSFCCENADSLGGGNGVEALHIGGAARLRFEDEAVK